MASKASYKGRRMSLPRLANTYCALQESFQFSHDDGATLLLVPGASSDTMNTIHKWEPIFSPNALLTNSPLATAMFARYNEFRIRKATVRVTPTFVGATNQARSDAWIFWCQNHTIYDSDEKAGEGYANVVDLAEASRIQHVQVLPGRSFSVDYVPQVVFNNAISIAGVATDQSGDGKMPWMATTPANAAMQLRAPVIFFRRPHVENATLPVLGQLRHQYQTILIAVIEFRNISDDN